MHPSRYLVAFVAPFLPRLRTNANTAHPHPTRHVTPQGVDPAIAGILAASTNPTVAACFVDALTPAETMPTAVGAFTASLDKVRRAHPHSAVAALT